ncbi:hypothetical protein Misp01_31570 [Microtetraspora sp. NBRC 13810]|uniref:roadblock/LC7 domain-containing protein n=1 Tax=Microtetraspora sp. NBRC 13810 TaxID=3030990 RepID=UPI0024A56632|nr:roadblock/LC7 domain-containing protein [Microtetraspora sp. NBRC 13810]GLW08027.1 hypothetical protein Misp01_31570 [Microtetraspora sp. NBRC 13810]
MDPHPAAQVRGVPLRRDMSWILTPLLNLADVTSGVVLTRDGLVLGSSSGVPREDAEATAAMASSALAAGRALRERLTRSEVEITETVINAADGFTYIAPAGDRAAIVVATGPKANIGALAYEVQLVVQQLIKALDEASSARTPGRPA